MLKTGNTTYIRNLVSKSYFQPCIVDFVVVHMDPIAHHAIYSHIGYHLTPPQSPKINQQNNVLHEGSPNSSVPWTSQMGKLRVE
jgi:hypothetical protein